MGIKDEGAWTKWDWTVKVDIDAIFIPQRLRKYLEKVEVTDNGVYLENCKYVNYGFFGSLAVISHDAAATYMANLDDCKSSLNYMGKEKPQATSHGVRTCSSSAAWICIMSTKLLPT